MSPQFSLILDALFDLKREGVFFMCLIDKSFSLPELPEFDFINGCDVDTFRSSHTSPDEPCRLNDMDGLRNEFAML